MRVYVDSDVAGAGKICAKQGVRFLRWAKGGKGQVGGKVRLRVLKVR